LRAVTLVVKQTLILFSFVLNTYDVAQLLNSTAAMYLRPAMNQAGSRLNVLTNALVTRVTFNKRQATGIEYLSRGQKKQAFATREVWLSSSSSSSTFLDWPK